MEHRVIVREKMKPYKDATTEEKDLQFERDLEELRMIKPDSMIILYGNRYGWGNIIYGEFSIGILKELTKEFENAYAEIMKRSMLK